MTFNDSLPCKGCYHRHRWCLPWFSTPAAPPYVPEVLARSAVENCVSKWNGNSSYLQPQNIKYVQINTKFMFLKIVM